MNLFEFFLLVLTLVICLSIVITPDLLLKILTYIFGGAVWLGIIVLVLVVIAIFMIALGD